MRNLFSFFTLFFILSSCKHEPTYDPFDPLFNIDVDELVKDDCDTISAGCGYFNLSKKFGQFSVFYQIYMDAPSVVLAKGLTLHIDTITTLIPGEDIFNLFENEPVDTTKIDQVLEDFNLSRNSTKQRDEYSKCDLIYQDSIGNQFHFERIIKIDSNDLRGICTYELFISREKK